MSDSEYEEEEFLVYADFKNQLMSNEFNDGKTAIKIIGMEGQNPIAEVNGNIFKGTYDFAMGTNVFFEKDTEVPKLDALFETNCAQHYKYYDKANKIINFKRVYVESKSEKPTTETKSRNEVPEDNPTEDNFKIDMTYEEAIQLFPASSE